MLLDDSGNLKLADFGLADLYKYQGKEKKLKEACGSAPYAAPEVGALPSLCCKVSNTACSWPWATIIEQNPSTSGVVASCSLHSS